MSERRRGSSAGLGLCVLLVLSGCSLEAVKTGGVSRPSESFQPESSATSVSKLTPTPVPDDDPLLKVLIAEFAGKRDQLPLAVTQYLSLAEHSTDPEIAERATRIAVYADDGDAALRAAERWVILAPASLDARQLCAAILIRKGMAEEALVHLKYVMANDRSSDSNRFHAIAGLLGREQDRQTALTVMEALVAHRPDDNEAQVAYALLAMRAEDLPKARAAMDRLVTRVDVNPSLALAYVALLQKKGAAADGIGFLERALRRKPHDFGLRLLRARLLADARRFEDARGEFNILRKDAPDNDDVLYALGLLNLQANKVGDAEKNFLQLAKSADRQADAAFYLAQIEESRGKTELALKRYADVTTGPNVLSAKLRTAVLLGNSKRVDEARKVLAGANPESTEERSQLKLIEAEILASNDRMDEAMAVYDKALDGVYDMPLLYNRAMLAERMGKLDVLEADLKTILAREPDNAQALNALGFTLADRTTRYTEAREYVEKALRVGPDDFYVLDSMGWVLFKQGQVKASIAYFEKARARKDDPEVAAHLGEALWTLGRKDEARAVWRKALAQHPQQPKVLETVKRLDP